MKRIKSILIFLSMLLFLVVCVQLYLIFRTFFFDVYSGLFFYGILFLTLVFLVIVGYKKWKLFTIAGFLFLTGLISIKLFSKQIEDYYFKRAVSTGKGIKKDLQEYYFTHKEYPDSLTVIYGKSLIPGYDIGLLRYDFAYYKTDNSYVISFDLFDGSMFRSTAEFDVWTLSD